MRRDLGRPRQARTRCLLVPREAEEEALELDAVVERRGREMCAPQSFMEGRRDGVHEPDEARGEGYPRVAESINGLVTPSSKLASDQVGGRRGDVPVSVTGCGDLHGLVRTARQPPVRDPRRWHYDAPSARDRGRRRNHSRCAELHWISRPLRSLGVQQTKGWQARRPLEGRNRRHAKAEDALDGAGHRKLHSWLLRC